MNPKQITTHLRLKRLRDLVAQVEQMPPSPQRDRVLQEIRSRAVDVDTGVSPRAMLPVEPAPPIFEPRPFVRRMSAVARKPVPRERANADSVASSNGASSQAAAHSRSRPILPSPQKSWLLRDDELLPLEDGPPRCRIAAGHEQQRLTKVPAFEVHPWRDTILDGLGAFETTGETVLVASQQAIEPSWICGGCDAPLAVGTPPRQLVKRVLRCGKCRSYNRAVTG
jgi:hypothetical protein